MSNPSRIAMLAQMRSDLLDETHAADVRGAALKAAGLPKQGPDVIAAQQAMDRALRSSVDTARLMLAQPPSDLADVLSLMLAATEATDAIQDYACGDTTDGAQILKLAELLDDAVSNVAVLLARDHQPRNDCDRRVAALLTRRLAPALAAVGGEA
ncbi:hypothetical protein ASE78_05885 [Sphingomonas sp. Leaf25]|nr:hypothetical protein ASE78_05885 [Sphingomonas sp. Leaf25]